MRFIIRLKNITGAKWQGVNKCGWGLITSLESTNNEEYSYTITHVVVTDITALEQRL